MNKRYHSCSRLQENTWYKEDELKELKSKLAAIDRKIQLKLAPPAQEIMEEDIH